eukprot:TRINITY_DN21896_c0_g1_i1.p1 TRINITY_DN21896_c0_g1~~TRINITY_DN21896_c0_g1_i1.p1  ORF type:complete len:625 (+),score=116.08 TRINITY_DN21896_c0_g1_i1:251-1876(+)
MANTSNIVTSVSTRTVVSNSTRIEAPKKPTLIQNTLLFLPERAVLDLGIEPNMDDKGDPMKELWFGRVWELKELLQAKHKEVTRRLRLKQGELSETTKKELSAKLQDPKAKKLVSKLAARWKGAAVRSGFSLNVLDRLKYSNLRGTLLYAHGSGGCSWDNFRICRMIARLGILVIAPDDFAYPSETAMGQIRHKDLLPLKKATDNVDYWVGDLMYGSGSQGELTYSTKAENVLLEPDSYRELYEKVYQLRRSELHFVISRFPRWIRTQGFFLGGTSEGAMTIARFDDQRYGEQVIGRFINSFGIEYCYFTPTEQAGQIGGQLDIPTLNIIGTKDQYFGAEDSVAKIVASDPDSGYGNQNLTGNGYNTMKRQGVDIGLVCVLEDGVHSPCNTHDNFLRQLFQLFFSRPSSIWEIDRIWQTDATMSQLIQVQESTSTSDEVSGLNLLKVFVPTMPFPNKMPLWEVEALRRNKRGRETCNKLLAIEKKDCDQEKAEVKAELDKIRSHTKQAGGSGFSCKVHAKQNFYATDVLKKCNKAHMKRKV